MNRIFTILFFTVVVAQVLGLVTFALIKQSIIASGTEIVLQGTPVDPRSLLQGDYAILDYEIAVVPDEYKEVFASGDRILVWLEKADGVWEATRYASAESVGLATSDDLFLRGTMQANGRIDFGIGTYFVPEGTGRAVETAADLKVRVSIDGNGNATVIGVIVDGVDLGQ